MQTTPQYMVIPTGPQKTLALEVNGGGSEPDVWGLETIQLSGDSGPGVGYAWELQALTLGFNVFVEFGPIAEALAKELQAMVSLELELLWATRLLWRATYPLSPFPPSYIPEAFILESHARIYENVAQTPIIASNAITIQARVLTLARKPFANATEAVRPSVVGVYPTGGSLQFQLVRT
jgi:hypothetical protein